MHEKPGYRPDRYETYWRDDAAGSRMTKAAKAVCDGDLSIRKAAEKWGLPPTSVFNHVKAKDRFGRKPGHPQYLSASEETDLTAFVKRCGEIGLPRTPAQVNLCSQGA
jgi:hypothetical protein